MQAVMVPVARACVTCGAPLWQGKRKRCLGCGPMGFKPANKPWALFVYEGFRRIFRGNPRLFAATIGVDMSTPYHWMRGHAEPTRQQAMKVAEAFGDLPGAMQASGFLTEDVQRRAARWVLERAPGRRAAVPSMWPEDVREALRDWPDVLAAKLVLLAVDRRRRERGEAP